MHTRLAIYRDNEMSSLFGLMYKRMGEVDYQFCIRGALVIR